MCQLSDNIRFFFTKVKAKRLSPILQCMIHPGQVSFIPTREGQNIIIYSINVIVRHLSIPMLLLSTDAEIAFYRVNWTSMHCALAYIGVPESMLTWIEVLYFTLLATVWIIGSKYAAFNIYNITRQGASFTSNLCVDP